MAKFLIFLSFLFALCSVAKAQKVYNYRDKRFIYKLTIDSALSDDSVNYQCSVKSIRITRKADHKLIQTIHPPKNKFFCNLDKDAIFVVEDMNFDGSNDLRLIQFIPAAPNTSYYYWTFNGTTQKFIHNKAFDDITTPEFDHKAKLIYSSWRGGWGDYGSSTYKLVNGDPVLIEENEINSDENDTSKKVSTLKRRINGKMRVVKRTVESAK